MSEYTGKDVSYYLVEIAAPKRLDPYTAECEDIIEALGMSFAEGCAFKAIWRKCAARTLGVTKAGYKGGLYDAEKTQYYGARMVAAEERLVPGAPGYELLIKCEECKTVSRGGRLHVCTCSQLTAPEEYKAEAQVAFDEAAELSEALARQVSAGKIDIGFDWGSAVAEEEALLEAEEEPAAKNPSIIDDYEEWHCLVCGAVHTRIGHTHQRTGFNPCNPWCPEPVRPEEPAAAMDDDSPRMQAIGQNGNDGEHYDDDPWGGAPEWAKYKAQDMNGEWRWYARRPVAQPAFGYWVVSKGRIDVGSSGEPNPNWRDTLITRT